MKICRTRYNTGIILALTLALTAPSCTVKHLMVDEMATVIEKGMPAFEGESDLSLLEKAFPANIKLLESLLVSRPKNERMLILLSRMYAGYAFAFFEGKLDGTDPGGPNTDAAQAALNRYYLKGAEYALRALELRHPDGRQQLSKVTTIESFMNRLTPEDLPALFWYGFNLGAYVNRNRDSMVALAKAFPAEKAMLRSVAMDEAYYYGSAHLFLMINYAARPAMMGGSLEKSMYHYKRLKTVAGEQFLLGDVYFARTYLQRSQDRNQFEEKLNRVIGVKPEKTRFPFLNAVAVERAAQYLESADPLFED